MKEYDFTSNKNPFIIVQKITNLLYNTQEDSKDLIKIITNNKFTPQKKGVDCLYQRIRCEFINRGKLFSVFKTNNSSK